MSWSELNISTGNLILLYTYNYGIFTFTHFYDTTYHYWEGYLISNTEALLAEKNIQLSYRTTLARK